MIPVLRQVTPVVAFAAYTTARTLVFPSAILLGSTIVVCGAVAHPTATSMASVIASVTMTGCSFQRRAEVTLPWSDDFGCTVWSASRVTTAGATSITVTPGFGTDNYCGLIAFELTGVSTTLETFEGHAGAQAEGVNSLSIGPMPSTGSLSQADTMAIALSMVNMGGIATANQGWTLPAGWTLLGSQENPTGAILPFQVIYKTATSQNAVSVTVNSTVADLNGRASVLFMIRGDVAATPAPPPPPPGPAPSPPPPAPAQAVKVSGVQSEVAGLAAIYVQVFTIPGAQAILGDYLFSDEAAAFEVALEAGDAVMYIPVPGGVVVDTGANVVVVGQTADGTGGFRGGVAGLVVDV